MIYRKMEEIDLEQVAKIEKETFSIPWKREDFYTSMINRDNLYLVAASDQIICGYCGVWNVAGEGQINNIAIRKEYQRQGIGAGLMQFLTEESRQKRIRRLTLEVRKSNAAALALYEKLNYIPEGIRKGFYDRPKEDAIIMSLYL